ncbi:tRNA threonylcarbamoyladenosine biosynthesis protein RimN, partial [Pseudomonas aeruginosa]|nr:tRNA threonylcarbamoyladenosine biosynthesis protein RimN [Pseudomonas aeruginosa]
YSPAVGDDIRGGAVGGRRNPSLIRDLVTGQVIRPA